MVFLLNGTTGITPLLARIERLKNQKSGVVQMTPFVPLQHEFFLGLFVKFA